MICRKSLELPDDQEPQDRQSFRASANHVAAAVDPSKGMFEAMESELTPLMPIQNVKHLLDVSLTDAAPSPFDDMTAPNPLLRRQLPQNENGIQIVLDMSGEMTGEVLASDIIDEEDEEVLTEGDLIDTEDANAEHALFLESARLKEAAAAAQYAAEKKTERDSASDFKEETMPFELVQARHSENLPMVFDCPDPSVVSTVPSIPAAKRHKLSMFAASAVILALGATDLLASRASERPNALAVAARGGELQLVTPASAPPAPPSMTTSNIAATSIPSLRVEDLPETVIEPSTPATKHAAPKRTLSETLTMAGDRAIKHHDLDGARAAYARAIASNPSYFPARLGIADVAWAAGDRSSASALYRALGESFPASMLPSRVFERKVPSR